MDMELIQILELVAAVIAAFMSYSRCDHLKFDLPT